MAFNSLDYADVFAVPSPADGEHGHRPGAFLVLNGR
jgi:hypothetical protein